jgi:exodeoxyribonuclease V beta subunit
VARLERAVDPAWRRSSYSSIIAGVEDEQVASEPEGPPRDHEPADAAVPAGDGSPGPLAAVALPLAGLPAGVELGSLVHAVLEQADFAAPDLGDELAFLVAEEAGRRAVAISDPAVAAMGLLAAIETPLAVGARLRDIRRSDRLDELAFELPLVGGDAPTGAVHPGDIADLLERHLDPGDPLAAYPARLREPGISTVLRGYLIGAVDLVARLPDGRFAVVDYKTNRLGGDAPSISHYRPEALAAEMTRAHYPLQTLLYQVALHRYLRWRLPGYRPDRHLAGAGYLFLRGMVGPETPEVEGQRCGVFWWRPPDALVPALSDLLAQGAP